MLDWLFRPETLVFTIPALLGTGLFLFKLVVLSTGIHGAGLETDIAGPDAQHGDSAGAFKLLSVQALVAFAMGFGWGGLALRKTTDWGTAGVMLGAIGAGVLMAWLLGLVLRAMFELQSSGNVSAQSAVGLQGSVYVTVPGNSGGRGQVQVVIDGKQRTYNAVTAGESIATGSRVSILRVNDDNTLTVSRA